MATTITPITQSITTIPTAGHRGVESRDDFVTKQEAFQDALTATTVTELNTLKTQLNTSIGQINLVAGEASTSATTATTKASEASTSATTATTKASEASTSATTATTKASEASTSASQAETFKNNASTSAATATTKASEASASATSASTSAATATTKASEASASATSASTSASEALTSRNQAETFAQQAQDSALSVDASNIVHKTGNETIADNKTFTGTVTLPTTTSIGTVSSTELGYLDGATSNIQTQLAGKAPSSHTHPVSQVTGLGTAATRDVGTGAGNVMDSQDVRIFGGANSGITTPDNITSNTITYSTGTTATGLSQDGAIYAQYYSVGSYGHQIYGDYRSGGLAVRGLNNGVWTPWRQVYHTGNLPITEQVYNLTGTEISPANGTIQYKTVSANTTFTETLTAGQSVILRLINANSYTITFPTITWVGVTAPILTANCAIVLWKEQSTLYGAYVGSLV